MAGAQTSWDSAITVVADTVVQQDTLLVKDKLAPVKITDSVSKRPVNNSGWTMPAGISFSSSRFSREVLAHHPYFNFSAKPLTLPESALRKVTGKEFFFYLLVFLLIVFAILRRAFPKYFGDLFRLFFRTTLKQRQIRDQLMQTPLPSLLMNGFFVVSGGLYCTFLLQHFDLNPVNNFWLLFLYCCLVLSAAYFIKFIGLKISGWLFNMNEAADAYIFIVFIVNKMIGILLLPFLILLAFSVGDVYAVSLTLSLCLVAGLLLYRFILTYAAIRNQVKVNPFHFFLYLCAFEIAPLLLVYKGLLLYFGITA
ncbi:MAG: DUF4271 domain-containing protein [Bacteroidota bacterium]|nr:DUF4271 domain-containing protein [Bacteroidota bacterium]